MDVLEELELILKLHSGSYPKMQPVDAVKLIFQNEFGGGHLITDEAQCLQRLQQEYESVEKDPDEIPWIGIGNGLIRVHLASLEREDIPRLCRAFIDSAAACRGNLQRFREKLEVLRRLAYGHCFSFSGEALDAFLAEYEAAGYPQVSHSQLYRQLYHPAYRVILGPGR